MKKEREIVLFKDITNRFAQESHCCFIQVASLAVRNGHIVATGINGTPSGYENCDDHFEEYWLQNALLKERANHPNGSSSLDIEDFHKRWFSSTEFRNIHHEWSSKREIHSEVNMVADASTRGVSLKGCDVYVSYTPCESCAKLLVAIQPKAIYYINDYDKGSKESEELITSNGIPLIKI